MNPRNTHKKRDGVIVAVLMAALLAISASAAFANAKNSIQPAHVYFGRVVSGQHPNRLVTLHNGTGKPETIAGIRIAGAGGYIFTIPRRTALVQSSRFPECSEATLQPGARCVLDIRVHTSRPGWWRSVLSVIYGDGTFNSAELRAHVVS